MKTFVAGKSLWLRNNVTGRLFEIAFRGDAYTIKAGRIVANSGDAPYEMAMYKLGDRYLAARSDAFGFVNYEVVAEPADTPAPAVASAGAD